MGKNEKKRKAAGRIALVAGAVVVVVLLALFVMPRALYRLRGEDAADVSAADDQLMVTFPMDVEGGKLRVENLVPFDGWNPDSGDQSGTNIAAIVVTNLSDTYLARGDIAITTDDGQTLHFILTDVPAGASVMAFDTDNATVGMDTVCGALTCQAQFDDAASLMADGVAVSVTGSHITLENNTEKDIANLVVYCHGLLGDQYFGGITYTYTVDNLAAGGTAGLDADDCALGLVEVVRVTANEP